MVQDFLHDVFRSHFFRLCLVCDCDAVAQNVEADCTDIFRDDITTALDECMGFRRKCQVDRCTGRGSITCLLYTSPSPRD